MIAMDINRFTGTVRSILVAFFIGVVGGGCTSIHSASVRELIDREAGKIQEATANSKGFVAQTEERNKAYQTAVSELDKAAQTVHTDEALFSLIFSSNQNVEPKSGIDALAVAYLAGELYLRDQAGLDSAVKDQFTADFTALTDLSKKIADSWKSIGDLQATVQTYAKQTGIASADPELVAALLKQGRIDTTKVDQVLSRSKQLNQALQGLEKVGVAGRGLERGQQTLSDVVDLLNRVKK